MLSLILNCSCALSDGCTSFFGPGATCHGAVTPKQPSNCNQMQITKFDELCSEFASWSAGIPPSCMYMADETFPTYCLTASANLYCIMSYYTSVENNMYSKHLTFIQAAETEKASMDVFRQGRESRCYCHGHVNSSRQTSGLSDDCRRGLSSGSDKFLSQRDDYTTKACGVHKTNRKGTKPKHGFFKRKRTNDDGKYEWL